MTACAQTLCYNRTRALAQKPLRKEKGEKLVAILQCKPRFGSDPRRHDFRQWTASHWLASSHASTHAAYTSTGSESSARDMSGMSVKRGILAH